MRQSIILFCSVLVSVIFYWIINGVLFLKLKKARKWYNFVLSYLLTLVSNVLKVPFESFLEYRSILEEYIVFPLISTLALNTIILLMVNIIIGEQEKQQAQTTIAELNLKKLEAENQVLLQQLQPHFLFNALSILKSLIRENTELAEEYSIKLSDFLRYTVQSHGTELVSIREEMQFVHNYFDLQQIRFENAFQFQANIPPMILDFRVPVLAIQVLVENAFKHNYFTEKRPLIISIEYESDKLVVRNNLVSLKITDRPGTGLANLEKRYQFITGKKIEVNQTEDAFVVKIPVIEK